MSLALDRARGALLGLACGDAVGTTVEFCSRGTFEPVTDLVGGGPFRLRPGEWTDDTSMALCLAESLIEKGAFDPADQLERYVSWMTTGHLGANGKCFDVGLTVRRALADFMRTRDPRSGPTGPYTAGNGSIMRLAPVVLWAFPAREAVDRYAAASSLTTHGADEAVACCRILGGILCSLLEGRDRHDALTSVPPARWMSPGLRHVAAAGYTSKPADDIRGTGYAVASLEAALWCFARASSFEEAVLTAVNLGDDADTTGAVCGQLAGAHFGRAAIPERWLERLVMRDRMDEWAQRLLEATPEP